MKGLFRKIYGGDIDFGTLVKTVIGNDGASHVVEQVNTKHLPPKVLVEESISGTAENQSDINREVASAFRDFEQDPLKGWVLVPANSGFLTLDAIKWNVGDDIDTYTEVVDEYTLTKIDGDSDMSRYIVVEFIENYKYQAYVVSLEVDNATDGAYSYYVLAHHHGFESSHVFESPLYDRMIISNLKEFPPYGDGDLEDFVEGRMGHYGNSVYANSVDADITLEFFMKNSTYDCAYRITPLSVFEKVTNTMTEDDIVEDAKDAFIFTNAFNSILAMNGNNIQFSGAELRNISEPPNTTGQAGYSAVNRSFLKALHGFGRYEDLSINSIGSGYHEDYFYASIGKGSDTKIKIAFGVNDVSDGEGDNDHSLTVQFSGLLGFDGDIKGEVLTNLFQDNTWIKSVSLVRVYPDGGSTTDYYYLIAIAVQGSSYCRVGARLLDGATLSFSDISVIGQDGIPTEYIEDTRWTIEVPEVNGAKAYSGALNEVLMLSQSYVSTGDEPIGSVFYSQSENTLVWKASDDVLVGIGDELTPLFRNNTGSTISNGKAVMFSGTLGASGKVTVTPAIADGSMKSSYTIGMTTEDISNSEDGRVTMAGFVRGIDTTGSEYGESWSDGDIIYVSQTTAGYLTNVEPDPTVGQHISIGAVVYAHANNGVIAVRPNWTDDILLSLIASEEAARIAAVADLQSQIDALEVGSGGETSVIYDEVNNATGAALPAGSPVQLSAVVSDVLNVGYTQADTKATCTSVVLLMDDAAIDGTSRAIQGGDLYVEGNLSILMTDGSSPVKGSVLYVAHNNPSKFTTTEPSFPNYSCKVGKLIDVDYTEGSESFRIAVAVDVDPTLSGDVAVQTGGETMPISMTFQGSAFGTNNSSATYFSTIFIPQNPMVVNAISFFAVSVSTFYSARVGLYSPGTDYDTLLAESDEITSISTGVNAISLQSSVTLMPNEPVMVAIYIDDQASTFLGDSWSGFANTAYPNHMGRYQNDGGASPSSGMPSQSTHSQTGSRMWFGLS